MKELLSRVKHIEITAKERVLDLFSGMYHSAFKGKGIEPEDLREYVAGDDIRAISWPKTAQTGKLFVKNFREERDLTVFLIVDISASQFFGSHYETKRERIAEVGAVLALSAIYNQDRVGLILFSSGTEKYIPPKRGTRHGARIIRELLAFEPTEKGTDIAQALQFFNKVTKKRSIAFLLSDFLAPSSSYKKEFMLTSSKHDVVALCISDPEEKNLSIQGLVRFIDAETGAHKVVDLNNTIKQQVSKEREDEERDLKTLIGKSGAGIISIDTKNPYETALEKFFTLRKKRH